MSAGAIVTRTITIDRRFCGPPGCANGGLVCGLVAGQVREALASVRLVAPTPLERPLDMVRRADDTVELLAGDVVVARGRPSGAVALDIEVPPLPSIGEVRNAMADYMGRTQPFDTCFVCGTRRPPGEGMRIFPGRVAATTTVASTWTPDASLAASDGLVDPIYLWAALDCPSGWAAEGAEGTMLVLGELTAHILRRPAAGQPCVALGWPLRRADRKHFVASALLSESGDIFGLARATWFAVPAPPRA